MVSIWIFLILAKSNGWLHLFVRSVLERRKWTCRTPSEKVMNENVDTKLYSSQTRPSKINFYFYEKGWDLRGIASNYAQHTLGS